MTASNETAVVMVLGTLSIPLVLWRSRVPVSPPAPEPLNLQQPEPLARRDRR